MAVSGRLGSPENWDCMMKIFGTCFGQSWTDLGLKMVPGCFTCVLNCGLGCFEAGNDHIFRVQTSGTEVDEGAVHGQPTHCFWGLLKTVPICVLDRKRPCEFA